MNERIEQLAGQLGPVATIGDWGRVEWADNVYPQLGDKMYAAVDLAKFAELIVRECVDIVKHNIYEPDYRGGSQILESFENYQANRRAEDILNQIKQHFGVEE